MRKVAISAAIGVLAAAAVLAAAYYGVRLSPPLLMALAAALSVGAAVAILTRTIADKGIGKTQQEIILGSQLREVPRLIARFPDSGGTLSLSIKPDMPIDKLQVYEHPGDYVSKDIVVSLRMAGHSKFNPVELKRLFVTLKDQPGFVHLILRDSSNEFVGYIPGFVAKREFTGANAESQLAKYVNRVFEDDNNSIDLRQLEGAGKSDVVSDETKVSDAILKMAGGFKRLVVLRHGYHRKPIGLVNFSDVMSETLQPEMRSLLGG